MTHEWDPSITEAGRRLRQLLSAGRLDLPLPAAGHTVERLRELSQIAATEDVSVARLVEAHCDAVAILAERDHALPANALAGVWASRYGGSGLSAQPSARGWHLSGVLDFCSGAPLVDVALVDVALKADSPDGPRQLFAIDVRQPGITTDVSQWRTPALAGTGTGRVTIDVDVDAADAVGEPGFYLDRAGFWHGAIGVAACWAGAAQGLYDTVVGRVKAENPHAAAHLGRAWAACWMLDAVLERAGRQIDDGAHRLGMEDALAVRDLVASGCRVVMESVQRAAGPGPMAFDDAHAQRLSDLRLYIEQHHHDVDLAEVGRRLVARLGDRG